MGWFLWRPEDRGAVEIETAAISINLKVTEIIDTAEESAVHEAASAAAMQQSAIDGKRAKAEERSKPDLPDMTELERERLARQLQRQQQEHEQLEAEKVAEKRARQKKLAEERKRKQTEAERQHRKKKSKERERTKHQGRKSRANVKGKRGARQSAGAISASKGRLRDYGARIRAKIARNKPYGSRSGKVVVVLNVSLSGKLISARIARSSGNKVLDRNALKAVRRAAPFSKPPKGVNPGQLYFSIPINFQ